MLQQTPDGVLLSIKVIPKGGRNEIVGWEGDELKMRVKAPPEQGKANAEVIKLLAETLSIAKSRISIVQGETSRHKRVCIEAPLDTIAAKLIKSEK